MAPSVSIVIPVLNGRKYIDDIVRYLDEQTFRDFEVIMVVDMSSDDGTLEYIQTLDRPDLKVLTVDTAECICGPRNMGFDNASGEFVWFLDVDDRPLPTFLEKLTKIQKENDADIVACNFIYSTKKDKNFRLDRFRYETAVMDSEEAVNRRLHEKFPITSWSKIFRTSLLRDNGIRFLDGWCEDINHTYRAMVAAKTICYTDEPLYIYYQHSDSFCNTKSNSDKRGKAEQEAYAKLQEQFAKNEPSPEFRRGSAMVRIRSSGHMTYREFIRFAKSEDVRDMIKRDCSDPISPETLWYRLLPTAYYIAIQLFFRFVYYRDGRIFTRPQKRRGILR